MIQFINAIIFILSTLHFSVLYILSVQPARWEKKIGPRAYPLCRNLRIIASVFELVTIVSYIVYYFYPFNLPVLHNFSWPYGFSIAVAVLLVVPGTWLMAAGLRHAGLEAIYPKKEHGLYGGLYRVIRHPQALGEVLFWPAVAFLLNSPFLALVSLLWFPVFYLFCVYEEKDLLVRFGEDYARYRQSTGMFLPRFKRRSRHPS